MRKQAEGGLASVGAAHNGFGSPIAAMGISANDQQLKDCQTIGGKIEILHHAAIVSATDLIGLKMEISEGYKILLK